MTLIDTCLSDGAWRDAGRAGFRAHTHGAVLQKVRLRGATPLSLVTAR